MSPAAIVAAAQAAGMDAIALTDHQSAKNAPAVAECARRAGLSCLFGAEVQTAEEVHTLALFDSLEAAAELTAFVYAALPKRKNDPETFGDQPVVSWDEEIVEMEEKLLSAGCAHDVNTVAEFVHARDGIYIAAHVDRPVFAIPPALLAGMPFDAVELSRTADERAYLPLLSDFAVIRSSDAHHLCDVARVWTEADGAFSFTNLKRVLSAKATRLSPRLTRFS